MLILLLDWTRRLRDRKGDGDGSFISKPRWDLMFRVNNVTNNHNFVSVTRLSGAQSVGAVLQPRTFSLSLDLHY